MTTILTSDNVVFNVHRDFVEDAKLLQNFTEEFENDCVSLPNLDATTFIKMQHFFVHGYLEEYDSVKSVIVAADYMHYEKLIDHCAEYIATKVIKGMSPQQIKKYFENI